VIYVVTIAITAMMTAIRTSAVGQSMASLLDSSDVSVLDAMSGVLASAESLVPLPGAGGPRQHSPRSALLERAGFDVTHYV
jgi:hypothetical protein